MYIKKCRERVTRGTESGAARTHKGKKSEKEKERNREG